MPIIKPELWVRRDGLSSNFLKRIDFPSSVLLHWARGVFVEAFYVLSYFRPIVISKAKVMQTLLAQGKGEVEAGRRAGWAVLRTGEMFARRNEDDTF